MGSAETTMKNHDVKWRGHCNDDPQGAHRQLTQAILQQKDSHNLRVYNIYDHYFCLPEIWTDKHSRKGEEQCVLDEKDYKLLLNTEISSNYKAFMVLVDYLDYCTGEKGNERNDLMIKRQYMEIRELHRRYNAMIDKVKKRG